jgi:hypothetical protein
MEPVMTQPTDGDSLKMWETEEGSISLSYKQLLVSSTHQAAASLVGCEVMQRTGTFFCEMTTAQSLPLTPNDVMFAAVIALNAYSVAAALAGVCRNG